MSRPRKVPLGRVRDAALTRIEYTRRAGRRQAGRRVVAIVGMHRSGTSAVAGTLQEAGLYLGNVSRRNEFEPKGTREHSEIASLHESILAHSGGSWRDPPPMIQWTDAHRARRDRLLESYAQVALWGFKDPRAVLALDFWREELGSLQLVGVFREPAAVVSSLLARDGGSEGEWFALWERYNDRLLSEHEASPFPLIEFDAHPARFHEQLRPVLSRLGLRTHTGSFFALGLQGVPAAQSPEVPTAAAQLYGKLRAASRYA